ncbi:alkaline phosphatase family protein [Actinomycetota bacterium]
MPKGKNKKVILLGFDGFFPELIERYKDSIPGINQILEESFYSPALPSPYTCTPTNWTTISTGSWIGTHGITSFSAHLKGMELGESVPTFNSDLCQAEYFSEAAERQGKFPILINYPTAFPLKIKNGIVVGGDGLYSKEWTVRWADYITTSKDKEIIHSDMDVIQQLTSIDISQNISWKNIPDDVKAISESKIVFRSSESKFEWGAEGIKDSSENDELQKTDFAKELRYILIFRDKGDLRLAISREKDYKKVLTIISENEWSGWIKERFSGKDCMRQYKLLDISDDGKNITLYGTMAFSLKGWAHPPGIEEELLENCGPYIEALELSPDQGLTNKWFGLQTTCEILDMQASVIENYAKYLSKKADWDVMFVQYHVPDGIGHLFLGDLESPDPKVVENAEAFIKYSVRRIFEFIKTIKKCCTDENTVTCIISDHGNLTKKSLVNINKIMIEEGFEIFKRDKDVWQLDTKKSKAIFTTIGVWVNLKDREKYGFISPGREYEALRDSIINRLRKIINPENNEPVFDLVGRREAFECMGMWGERIPDVVAFASPYYLLFTKELKDISEEEMEFYKNGDEINPIKKAFDLNLIRPLTAVHWNLPSAKTDFASTRAIVILNGPGIVKNKELDRVNLVDIAPTLARILGIEPPANCEGRIIKEAFLD